MIFIYRFERRNINRIGDELWTIYALFGIIPIFIKRKWI